MAGYDTHISFVPAPTPAPFGWTATVASSKLQEEAAEATCALVSSKEGMKERRSLILVELRSGVASLLRD